jgi:hypothetical protein
LDSGESKGVLRAGVDIVVEDDEVVDWFFVLCSLFCVDLFFVDLLNGF